MVSSTDPTALPTTSQAPPAPAATATTSAPSAPGLTTTGPDSQQPGFPQNPYGAYPPPSPTSGGFSPQPGYPGYPYPPQGFYPPQAPQYPQPPSPQQPGAYPQYPPPGQQLYAYPAQQFPPPQQQPGQGQQFPSPNQPFPPQPYPQQYPYPPQQFQSSVPENNLHGVAPKVPKEFSPGYGPGENDPNYNPTTDAAVIKKALEKDRKIDLDALLAVLPKRTPVQIEMLKPHLYRHNPAELTLNSTKTDDGVKSGIHALLFGPRDFDAFLIYSAISKGGKGGFGSGFKSAWMLSLALLGRKNGDIDAIQEAYKRMYGDNLVPQLKEALKDEPLLGHLYQNVLYGVANPGIDEAGQQNEQQTREAIDKEADELFTATVGNVEGEKFAWLFATSSQKRLKNICDAFERRHKQKLYDAIDKKFKEKHKSFRDELLYLLDGLGDGRANRDAKLIEETMKGFGTRDTKLIYRVITAAWDKEHLTKVKSAYHTRYPGKGSNRLATRIKKDTSGDQEKFLIALVESDGNK